MRPRFPLALIATALAALLVSACGSEGMSVSADDPDYEGATIFAERCSGCHTLSVAGSQGSGNRAVRAQGPNFDEREESYEDALYAIQNGGFSGAIMPQNIVVGEDAEKVARFLAEFSGTDIEESLQPTPDEDADLGAEESGNPPPDETPAAGE